MAGMKSWLEKIKNRILKKDFDDDLIKSKIQSEDEITTEIVKENELPDLITPINEDINEIQREEAIRLNEKHEITKVKENKILPIYDKKGVEKDFVHFTDVPKRTKTA